MKSSIEWAVALSTEKISVFVRKNIGIYVGLNQKAPLVTLEQFWDWYPNGYEGRFELHNGVIVKMQPTGTHEQVAGFLVMEIGFEIKRLGLPLFIRRQGLIKTIDTNNPAYIPDVMVLDNTAFKIMSQCGKNGQRLSREQL